MSVKLLFQGLMTDVMMNFTGDIQLAALCFRLAICCVSVAQWPGLSSLRQRESLLLFSEIFDVFFVGFASSNNCPVERQ